MLDTITSNALLTASKLLVDMPGTIGFVPGGGSFFGGNVTKAVNNGSLSIDRVDDMCRRIMTPYFYLQQQQASYPQIDGSEPALNGNSRIYSSSLPYGQC